MGAGTDARGAAAPRLRKITTAQAGMDPDARCDRRVGSDIRGRANGIADTLPSWQQYCDDRASGDDRALPPAANFTDIHVRLRITDGAKNTAA